MSDIEANNKKIKVKDVIIVLVYLVLTIFDVVLYVTSTKPSGGGIVEHIILITLGYVGLIEVLHAIGWSIFVPSFYENYVDKRQHEIIQEGCKSALKNEVDAIEICIDKVCNRTVQECFKGYFEGKNDSAENYIKEKQFEAVHECIEKYFDNEICFVKEYSEEHIQYIMAQLGITKKQFDTLHYELIKMRGIKIENYNDAKRKIECTLKCDYPIIIKQESIPDCNRSYNLVRYFINYNVLAFEIKYLRDLASVLVFLIKDKSNIKEIDKIVIPYDGNYLLGIEVGNVLGIPIVKMREKGGRIEKDKPWDGNIAEGDRVIIVHDVMVTGDQIEHAINKLPQTCEKLGVYCLIDRKEYNGKADVEANDVSVYSVMELGDDDIREIRGE